MSNSIDNYNRNFLDKKAKQITDADLWIQAKNGNRESFDLIIRRYYPMLFKYGLTIHTNAEDVKDAIHELFINIWLTRKNLSDVKSVKYYLHLSLRRLILKELTKARKNRNKLIEVNYGQNEVQDSYETVIINTANDKLRIDKVKKAINLLPKRQKEAIILRFYQSLPYDDIVTILGISYESSRNLVSQALKSLKNSMKTKTTLLS